MVLLAIIYIAFISLGLPDSLLGAAWPTMRVELGAALPMAGAVSMVCSAGTIVSSLCSARVVRRFGTGRVAAFSTAMTAVALLGCALAPSAALLFAAAIPLGLGAGSIDAALNNYVSLHYEAKHMSWLHCFWGLGASIGPVILAVCIGRGAGWRGGYLVVVSIQGALALVLCLTQRLWRAHGESAVEDRAARQRMLTNAQTLRLPGMRAVLVTFFSYSAAESSMILWIASYARHLGATAEQASLASGLFFLGITLGRGLNGFLAIRFSSKQLIRAGTAVMLAGIAVMFLPLGYAGCLAAAGLIGLGCAPVYPCTIHETPRRFGEEASQAATGLQMACAYTGSTLMPPLMGVLSGALGLGVMPWWVLGLTLLMLASGEMVNRRAG